ncbi:MAG: tetraacyldisaccharide 4'-kinase [Candidatus Rifleibacteriota bacterium]
MLLSFLKLPYLAITTADRYFFKLFKFLVFKPKAKVVSIGNLSMGGTGKTPVLLELTRELADKKLCVVSRGYRSPYEYSFYHLEGKGPHPEGLTDEALLFNRNFPEIPLLLGKRRDRSCRYAESRLNPELILLDDGFQFRRLRKDIEIVLWDSLTKPKEADLIPVGRLREPISRLQDASAILLTRCESASQEQINFWMQWLKVKAPEVPVIKMKTICAGLFNKQGYNVTLDDIKGSFYAFSAIGRPESFLGQLQQMGISVKESRHFRDHHRFTDNELIELQKEAASKNLRLVCTEKDRVKISDQMAQRMDLFTLGIRMVPESDRKLTDELLKHGIQLDQQA